MNDEPRDDIFILTDGCMWEKNRKEGTGHSHAVEVVNAKTGAVRYINSGSRVRFVDGEITDLRTQKGYNEQHERGRESEQEG